MKTKQIMSCECGCKEFIDKPSGYNIYQLVNGVLVLCNTEWINDESKVFCRDCGKEYEYDDCRKLEIIATNNSI